ncbi:MAG TPA: SRPBCC family protein [Candidatus Dormibacteraeota bacterium]|nr:SRPBCC family protein [Candidatus Dormibacteraeota bacterium]
MRRVVMRRRYDRPAAEVFAACVDLLRTPDERRGVVARRVTPDPPGVDAVVSTTIEDTHGERELRATVVAFEPGVELATVTDGAPAVRTGLRCEPDGRGGTVVTLTSEAEGTLSAFGRAGVVLDWVLFARGQRRAARATLMRLDELALRR